VRRIFTVAEKRRDRYDALMLVVGEGDEYMHYAWRRPRERRDRKRANRNETCRSTQPTKSSEFHPCALGNFTTV
jgi:hypothetical protein